MSYEASSPRFGLSAAQPGPTADLAPAAQPLEIRFTGSGSEYFRIWIVNLLLILVTLSLYAPFAKARKLRYLQANTLVDGDALGFHGDPWKMLRGYLLILLLAVVYGASGHFSPLLAVATFLLMMALWPALWRASLQFRLANTSWRGLRFQFTGHLAGAYLAWLPSLLAGGMVVGGSMLLPQGPTDVNEASTAVAWTAVLVMLGSLLGVGVLPWTWARLKRYQHSHYRYAQQQTQLKLGTGAFYGLGFRLLGLSMLGGLAILLLLLGAAALSGPSASEGPDPLVLLVAVPAYLLFISGVSAYTTARLQNLVWSATQAPQLSFTSRLALGPYWKLTLKNLLLTGLTLGLYRPFAVIAAVAMRLQAMRLDLQGDLSEWQSAPTGAMQDATGDAAGDFFGIDIGL
jgi:uncharacterized membrane protein YjgN (DUF898 family)